MSTAAVSSSSIFQELQSFYQTRQSDLQQLGSDIKSGNLTAAQQDFQALAVLGEGGPFANSEPFSNSSRAQNFNALGEALQAGDLGRAQTAFNALTGGQTSTAASTAANPATVVNLFSTQPASTQPASTQASTAATTTNATSIYQQLQAYRQQRTADLAQLGKDLQAGDLTAAQTDFNTLSALGQSGPTKNGQVYQQTARAQDFQAIGTALQGGDLAGAQTAYTALAASFGGQSQQAQSAISAYNSGVTEIIINLNLGSSTGATSTGTATPTTVPTAQPAPTGSESTSATPELVLNLFQGSDSSGSSSETNSGSGGIAEILLNLGATSNTNTSSGAAAPEVVINLNEGNSSSAQSTGGVTISVGNTNSGEQLTIAGAQGQNGTSAEPVIINLNPQQNYELILNLLNSSSTSNSSSALSVSA